MKAPTQTNPVTLTAPQIAQLLGVSRCTVWRWRREGVLPPPTLKAGRLVRWHRDVVDAFARGEVTA